MSDSALFAYVVAVQVPGTAVESVVEISPEQLDPEDSKPLDAACECALVELTTKYGAAVIAGASIIRVHEVTLAKKLVRGKEPGEPKPKPKPETASSGA